MKIKVNFKSFVLLALFTALSNLLSAQKSITGLVTDTDNGDPLVGASVVVTGTLKGTLTDVDGKYELQVPADATTLTYSFTGYSSLTIPIGTSKVIDAKLKGGTILETAVVVGYGTLKSKEVTGSVTSVKAEDFNKGNINDPVQLLQGKVAGLSISRPSGDPNGGFDIRLRGVSTIGSNVQPLIVVDGVPGIDLKLVDPNDIATFDVLKDGAAAAIYGASGSSGVILITTKKGSSGKSAVEYTVQLSNDAIAKKPAFLSASEFKTRGGTDLGANTDWYSAISRSALSHTHNLSLSGGMGKTSYRASLNYRNAQGVALKSGFSQLNGRFNLSQKALNDKMTFSFDASATNKDAQYGYGEAFRYAGTHNPTAPILDGTAAGAETGGYHQISGFDDYNPVALINQSTNEGKIKSLFLSGRAEYELAKGLKLSSLYSINREATFNGEYYSRLGRFRGKDRNGLASRYTRDIDENYFSTVLTYNTDFGKVGFNAVGGYDYRDRTSQDTYIQLGDFVTDAYGYDFLAGSNNLIKNSPLPVVGGGHQRRKLIAFFGRAAFNYDDTYFGTLTLRREGSTMFGVNNKWGLFPAVSAGVALNKVLNLKSFESLKLRAGYGVTGGLPGGEYYSQSTYASDKGLPTTVRNGNPDLKWEEKAELSVGLDFLALDARLSGTLEYYNRNVKDMLYFFENTAPGLFEKSGVYANAGVLTSNGVELSLGYQVMKPKPGGLGWKVDFNVATNQSIIKTITTDALRIAENGRIKIARVGAPGLNDDYMILVEQGKTVGQIWTIAYAGVNDKGQVLGYAADGVTKKLVTELADSDRKVFGSGLPKATLGLNNSFTYGNFDFNFFLRGAFGHSIINENRIFYENNNAGSIKSYNAIQTSLYDPAVKEARWTSLYIEKGDFIRLDNFTLGYNVGLPAGSAFTKARVYVSGNNLFTFTNYTGVNPEVRYSDVGPNDNGGRPSREFNPDPLAPGIDRRSNYYAVRSLAIGVNLGF